MQKIRMFGDVVFMWLQKSRR